MVEVAAGESLLTVAFEGTAVAPLVSAVIVEETVGVCVEIGVELCVEIGVSVELPMEPESTVLVTIFVALDKSSEIFDFPVVAEFVVDSTFDEELGSIVVAAPSGSAVVVAELVYSFTTVSCVDEPLVDDLSLVAIVSDSVAAEAVELIAVAVASDNSVDAFIVTDDSVVAVLVVVNTGEVSLVCFVCLVALMAAVVKSLALEGSTDADIVSAIAVGEVCAVEETVADETVNVDDCEEGVVSDVRVEISVTELALLDVAVIVFVELTAEVVDKFREIVLEVSVVKVALIIGIIDVVVALLSIVVEVALIIGIVDVVVALLSTDVEVTMLDEVVVEGFDELDASVVDESKLDVSVVDEAKLDDSVADVSVVESSVVVIVREDDAEESAIEVVLEDSDVAIEVAVGESVATAVVDDGAIVDVNEESIVDDSDELESASEVVLPSDDNNDGNVDDVSVSLTLVVSSGTDVVGSVDICAVVDDVSFVGELFVDGTSVVSNIVVVEERFVLV
uniref:Uncharacterized protein n=1 Tax=Plectus sambesii TaxID=2011161 RepID=A0A914WQ44_9BILA